MIVKTFVVTLVLSYAYITDVSGASYSDVYVEREVVPMGYYPYGSPYTSIPNPRLSQINSLPVPGYVAPCGTPCVYPAQTVATVTPVNPNPNVLTYNAPVTVPNVPIVVTKEEAPGYEYSYVVYDENTGDHKAQRELSDGSVVRGEYSFIQPDGFVREVQYVADDISGFNAVVKNYLPVTVEGKRKSEVNGHKETSTPCHETKHESLTEGSDEDSEETSVKHLLKIHEKLHNKHSKDKSAVESKEHHHGKSEESGEEEHSKEKHHKQSKNGESTEESEEESNEMPHKKPKHSKEESGAESEENTKEKHHIKQKHSEEESGEESDEKSNKKHHNKSKKISMEDSSEESKKSKGNHHKKSKTESNESGEESEEEFESDESKEELKEKSRKKPSKESGQESREKHKNKSKKEPSEEDSEESEEKMSHGKHKEAHELLKPKHEALVPYNDIIRCIQAAMRRSYGVPSAMRQEPSPLTYIVLNKPC